MAVFRDLKFFQQSGMDFNSAIEFRAKNDTGATYNVRVSGTQNFEEGYITNIESNQYLSASLPAGINRCIGSAGFEDMGFGLGFIYNSTGAHRLVEIDYQTQATTVIDISALNLNPQYYVDDINIINQTFLTFNDTFNHPGYINYQRLRAGGYAGLNANDFYLIKQQPPVPISASFSNDTSRSVNLLQTKGWQFRSEGVWLDYEYTAFSTISAMYYPAQENTPEVGTNVTVNNNLVLSVNVYTNRLSQLIIAATYGGLGNWFTIKTINFADILALPPAIDLSNQIYEAYNPATQTYYLVFYNDGLYTNIDVLQTDQLYDTVPNQAGSMAVLNGNELILGDITVGYPRPTTPVSLAIVNYNPNITIPPSGGTPLTQTIINPGMAGSGAGGHKRYVIIEYGGVVQENDSVTIVLVDTRNYSATLTYSFVANFAESGHTYQFIADNYPTIPNSSIFVPTTGTNVVGVAIITPPYYTLQTAYYTLFNAGSGIFRSIGALKSNSSYQLAKAEYDHWGKPLPLQTGTAFVVKTNSYAQSHGQTPAIQWQILDPTATPGAESYQWVISKNNTHQSTLFMLASILTYVGGWDAKANSPSLNAGSGTVGQVYQVTVPGTENLGNGGVSYNSGDFIINNGVSWDLSPKANGDLSSATSYYFYLNSLAQFNQKNSTSVLSYDFTIDDRCTLLYYQAPGLGNPLTWFDGGAQPVVDVQVQGYNPTNYLLKVNTSSSIDPSVLAGKDVLIEIYTPKQRTETDDTGTTVLNETVFYETGISYPVINGQYSVLQGTITDGDVYFKTRELGGSIDPNVLYTPLVEDFNFSDFYPSAFNSYGRPRFYSDVLEVTEQVANLVYSEIYIFGSKINGLTRFFDANIYGNQGGQTSSNYGRVLKMQQIHNQLLIIQELNHGDVPVYINIIEDQAEQQNVAISERILGNMRYTAGKHIGIGQGKDSFAFYQNICYWIDPHRSEPVRWEQNGAIPISGKMSKFFKQTLQAAYAQGLKIIGWYDVFNNEYIISIQQPGGVVTNFPFASGIWQYLATYSVLPASITIISGPSHSSASYDNVTGEVVLTPASDYVGNDTLVIQFPVGMGSLTKNACFNWTPGSGTVNAFAFAPQMGVPLSTPIQSTPAGVTGNDYPVSISISGGGGQYSINGGAFTSSPGFVNNGDTVIAQVTSSGSAGASTSTTVTIDGQSATFTVTTLSATVNTFNIINNSGSLAIQSPSIKIDTTTYSQAVNIPPLGNVTDNTGAGTASSTVIFYVGNGYVPSSSALTASGYGPIAGIWTGGSTAGYITFTGVDMSAHHTFTININP